MTTRHVLALLALAAITGTLSGVYADGHTGPGNPYLILRGLAGEWTVSVELERGGQREPIGEGSSTAELCAGNQLVLDKQAVQLGGTREESVAIMGWDKSKSRYYQFIGSNAMPPVVVHGDLAPDGRSVRFDPLEISLEGRKTRATAVVELPQDGVARSVTEYVVEGAAPFRIISTSRRK